MLEGSAKQPCNVAIYRMECNVCRKGVKRSADGKRPQRKMEFLNVAPLYHSLKRAMQEYNGRPIPSSHEWHTMELWACLVGFTGTDFTRSLPNIGTDFVWDAIGLQHIMPALIASYDTSEQQLVVSDVCDNIISKLYLQKYKKHAHGRALKDVLRTIKNAPKLSPVVKQRLPSFERSVCHLHHNMLGVHGDSSCIVY